VELTIGTAENVNVAPPFDVVREIEEELDDDTEKSDARPVLAPVKSETEMVQEIAAPTRRGLAALQLRLDICVGTP